VFRRLPIGILCLLSLNLIPVVHFGDMFIAISSNILHFGRIFAPVLLSSFTGQSDCPLTTARSQLPAHSCPLLGAIPPSKPSTPSARPQLPRFHFFLPSFRPYSRIPRFVHCVQIVFGYFLQKNPQIFAYVKKKYYLCTII
jgi:hypothetical protein